MASENAHIAALIIRGPTHEYQDYISVCRADGLAVKFAGTLSREMLTALAEANFAKRDGPESERNVTVFNLTDEGGKFALCSVETIS